MRAGSHPEQRVGGVVEGEVLRLSVDVDAHVIDVRECGLRIDVSGRADHCAVSGHGNADGTS